MITTATNNFNGILKKLTCNLARQFPSDEKIGRAKKKIMLGIDMRPIFIVETVGETLYEHREQIYNGESSFFIEKDHAVEARKGDENADLTNYIIPKVKEAWSSSGEIKKAEYLRVVQELLDEYLDYLAAVLPASDGSH